MDVWTIAQASSADATLDLMKVFQGAPLIYSVLLALSITSMAILLYSLFSIRVKEMMPTGFLNSVRQQLSDGRFESALSDCQKQTHFSAQVLGSGLAARKHGSQVMMEAMLSEGRRSGTVIWQRISLLSDIAVIAPMLGLLGTVMGMFFAFYDTTQSEESLGAIFDGLGIAIGTTVAGLLVAILAMAFHTVLKFRVQRIFNQIENEARSLVNLVDTESKA